MTNLIYLIVFVLCSSQFLANGLNIYSENEVSARDGSDDDVDVWLAIMGKVFNVTEGRGFYGKEGPYSVFGAKDATGYFVSGKFDEDSANSVDYSNLDEKEIDNLKHWYTFYTQNPNYPQIGVMIGLFYDEQGVATQLTNDLLLKLNVDADGAAEEL